MSRARAAARPAPAPVLRAAVREFLVFGLRQARACIFAGLFFAILLMSRHVPLGPLPRYDFIFLLTIGVQAALLLARVETVDEVLVLSIFHLIGLCLELFKTLPAIGSWSYPEHGYLKVLNVPIYSGFMYAAVASYMCQAWRLLDLELRRYPPYLLSVPTSVAIYLNFFTHHFTADLRWPLMVAVVAIFWRTEVRFTVTRPRRSMPLTLSFLLIGFFIWVAENISSYLGAYVYPEQRHAWTLVSFGKISSWFLLVIISFVVVADLKHIKARRQGSRPASQSGARSAGGPAPQPA